MAAHAEILAAARRICSARGGWTFAVDEIVRALPHLNAGTVRTHVTSRCCVNAPKHHPHKWDYFRRVGRGTYEITKAWRTPPAPSDSVAREAPPPYGETPRRRAPRRIVHATVSCREGSLTTECLEVPVVARARTLDDTLAQLKAAIALHLEDEDLDAVHLELTLPLSLGPGDDDELDALAAQGRLRRGTGQIDEDFWTLPAPRIPARALRRAVERERDDDR